MSSPSKPDWLRALMAEEGESKLIDVDERNTLLNAMIAAQFPKPIDRDHHRRILERALSLSFDRKLPDDDDPSAPASADEQFAANKLRDALDSDALVESLRSAYQPSPPRTDVDSSLREIALSKHLNQRPRRLTPTTWGVFAVAAAASLWFTAKFSGPNYPQRSNELVMSRSTESLFTKPFASSTNSERIDKITQVRSRELRNNRYAIWGLP